MTRDHRSDPAGESPIDAQLAAPPVQQSDLPAAGPTGAAPAPGHNEGKEWIDRPWVIVLLMLHVGLLGIPLYWKTHYSVGVRLLMIAASIVYTLAAVAFIYVMLRWISGVLFG